MTLGLIVTAVLLAAFVVVFVLQRRRKARDTSAHYAIATVDGFPITHVPKEAVASVEEAREVVVKLKEVYVTSWAAFSGIYGKVTRAAPIDTIGMSLGPVHPKHENVVWFAPSSKMRLRFQDSMYYHFAGELHNMFRFNLYGIKYIDKMKGKADRKRAIRVQVWIEDNYKGE